MQCQALTKKKVRCPIEDASPVDGIWYCHVHHPERLFQKQVAANRVDKAKIRASYRMKKENRHKRVPDYDEQLAALKIAKGIT